MPIESSSSSGLSVKAPHRPVRHEARTYRRVSGVGNLRAFQVVVKETDLHVQAALDLSRRCREVLIRERGYLETFIKHHPTFLTALTPWSLETPAPELVSAMIGAARLAGVGPMAAVAGALAECVGRDLMNYSENVIVENGGDIFLAVNNPATVGIDVGRSPLSGKIGLRISQDDMPLSICTSSGTLGHSLSYGKADGVSVIARQGAVADAAATAVANRVTSHRDLGAAIEFARSIPGVLAVLAVCGDKLGAWGGIEVVPLPT